MKDLVGECRGEAVRTTIPSDSSVEEEAEKWRPMNAAVLTHYDALGSQCRDARGKAHRLVPVGDARALTADGRGCAGASRASVRRGERSNEEA